MQIISKKEKEELKASIILFDNHENMEQREYYFYKDNKYSLNSLFGQRIPNSLFKLIIDINECCIVININNIIIDWYVLSQLRKIEKEFGLFLYLETNNFKQIQMIDEFQRNIRVLKTMPTKLTLKMFHQGLLNQVQHSIVENLEKYSFQSQKVMLVDLHNLYHRIYHANPDKFFDLLKLKLSSIPTYPENPNGFSYVIFVSENNKTSYRKDIYPDYKGNRKPIDEELEKMIEQFEQFIPVFQIDKFEADDAIGSLAKYFRQRNANVTIMTTDKDMIQLMPLGVQLYNPFKAIFISEADVINKYKVSSDQFLDYLTLVGDSSDNIKGVSGIGPKKAASLLQEHKSILNMYNNMNNLDKKMQDFLIKNHNDIIISRILCKIYTHLVRDFDFQKYKWNSKLIKSLIIS